MNFKLVLALIALFTVSQANADVVFSSFGPSDAYNNTFGNTMFGIAGSNSPFYQTSAFKFNTGSFSGKITSIEMPIRGLNSTLSSCIIGLTTSEVQSGTLADVPANDSVAPLFVWSYTAPSTSYAIATLTAAGGIDVTANTNYWVFGQANFDNACLWASRNTGVAGDGAQRNTPGGTWSSQGSQTTASAFRINGTPTAASAPEPGSLALLSLGALGLLGRVIRRRRK
jgi:hypothetical protein